MAITTIEPVPGESSSSSTLSPGPSPYHESSQYLNWRYSSTQLDLIRSQLNQKSVQVVGQNSTLEKVSFLSLTLAMSSLVVFSPPSFKAIW